MKQSIEARPNKDKIIGVLVDTGLHKRINDAAAKENRSVSQFTRLLIEQALAEKEKAKRSRYVVVNK
jgi:predicted HicB family RNase H-like nuclease